MDSARPLKALLLGSIDGGWEGGITVILGPNTTVFYAEVYAVKACVMEDIGKG
jgi:hypothetical protein